MTVNNVTALLGYSNIAIPLDISSLSYQLLLTFNYSLHFIDSFFDVPFFYSKVVLELIII